MLLVVGFGILMGESRGCGKDSEAAEYARSLSQDRLAQLYNDMEIYYSQRKSSHEDIHMYNKEQIPETFSDLEVTRISPSRAHIMVEGCFDNYMYMYFNGIENSSDKKEIILSYGEFETITEILWPR